MFLVGPNASGKSNFLDAIRFISDIARPEGSFQRALNRRGDITSIRNLSARRYPDVELLFELTDKDETHPTWTYELAFHKAKGGSNPTQVSRERVHHNGELLLDRPEDPDTTDPLLLTQTHLEQISANREFREIATFFTELRYVHLIPQIVRRPEVFFNTSAGVDEEAFGFQFLERVANTRKNSLESRLKKIEQALTYAVPQLRDLNLEQDEFGTHHLTALYEHWRPNNAGRQRESQFSDGTIRLIGLLWSILDANSLLLLEEPELSLHPGIVRHLAPMMHRIIRNSKSRPQVIVSTHSPDLLSDKGIAAQEIAIFNPGAEGTQIIPASAFPNVVASLDAGLPPGEVVIPQTAPASGDQLSLFG